MLWPGVLVSLGIAVLFTLVVVGLVGWRRPKGRAEEGVAARRPASSYPHQEDVLAASAAVGFGLVFWTTLFVLVTAAIAGFIV